MNERMAHFLTAPYMSIYYNAGSERSFGRRGGSKAKPVASASSFVYFLLFKVGVKVNALGQKEKFLPRAQLLINRYQVANLETARWSGRAICSADSWYETEAMCQWPIYENDNDYSNLWQYSENNVKECMNEKIIYVKCAFCYKAEKFSLLSY